MDNKTVLVIEDDNSIRNSLRDLLEMEGYCVLTASNGQKAVELLDNGSRPDLILLDLMMPVMDGFRFREVQLARPSDAAIPVVVMSADGNVSQKRAAIGAKDYIRKPVDVDDLLNRIAVCF